MTSSVTIDCDTCSMQHTDACHDCVVSFICSREPNEAVVIEFADLRAMRALGDAGRVPKLQHSAR